MAYIAFCDWDGVTASGGGHGAAPTRTPVAAAAVPSAPDRLSALEWSVVTIARRDGRSTLRRPGRLAAAIRALLGTRNPMLADTRLEALRRMAVLTWQNGYTVPPREVRAFLDAGFTPGQYETMVDRVSAAKRLPRRTVAAVATA